TAPTPPKWRTRRRPPPRSRRSGTTRTPCHRPPRPPPSPRACGTPPAPLPAPPRTRRPPRATPECGARPENRRGRRPVRRRPAWRVADSPEDRNSGARVGSSELDENRADRRALLLDAAGRTQFIRFHAAAEAHTNPREPRQNNFSATDVAVAVALHP